MSINRIYIMVMDYNMEIMDAKYMMVNLKMENLMEME